MQPSIKEAPRGFFDRLKRRAAPAGAALRFSQSPNASLTKMTFIRSCPPVTGYVQHTLSGLVQPEVMSVLPLFGKQECVFRGVPAILHRPGQGDARLLHRMISEGIIPCMRSYEAGLQSSLLRHSGCFFSSSSLMAAWRGASSPRGSFPAFRRAFSSSVSTHSWSRVTPVPMRLVPWPVK